MKNRKNKRGQVSLFIIMAIILSIIILFIVAVNYSTADSINELNINDTETDTKTGITEQVTPIDTQTTQTIFVKLNYSVDNLKV